MDPTTSVHLPTIFSAHPLTFITRPNRSVSMCQGLLRPSWFDIATLPPGDEYDEQAIAESITLIKDLILSQIQSGIDPRRIVLVGFSQGAALSLMVSLTALHELGGVVSLSGWIPPHAKDVSQQLEYNDKKLEKPDNRMQMMRNVPNMSILWLHGAADEEIPLRYAQEAISFLRSSLLVPDEKLQFNVYSGLKHATNEEEINDLGFWLQKTLV